MSTDEIAKPEGYDLRNKRSTKTLDGKDWEVQDALYESQERIKKQTALGHPAEAILVLWREKQGNNWTLRWNYSGNENDWATLLLVASKEMA